MATAAERLRTRKEHRVLAAQRYRGGESIRTISQSMGLSYGTVHALLKEGRVKFRQRGGPRKIDGA